MSFFENSTVRWVGRNALKTAGYTVVAAAGANEMQKYADEDVQHFFTEPYTGGELAYMHKVYGNEVDDINLFDVDDLFVALIGGLILRGFVVAASKNFIRIGN